MQSFLFRLRSRSIVAVAVAVDSRVVAQLVEHLIDAELALAGTLSMVVVH